MQGIVGRRAQAAALAGEGLGYPAQAAPHGQFRGGDMIHPA
jgi:hypothetical protein